MDEVYDVFNAVGGDPVKSDGAATNSGDAVQLRAIALQMAIDVHARADSDPDGIIDAAEKFAAFLEGQAK